MDKDVLKKLERKIAEGIPYLMGIPPDPRAQFQVLTDPPVKETMTYLKPAQVTFVTLAKVCAKDDEPFKIYDDVADELMLTMKSEKGRGIDALINFVRAQHETGSGSSVNIFSQMKEKAGKIKDKVKGEDKDG